VRIISGNLKGILITPPKGLPVRPTTDRAKESLLQKHTLNNLDVVKKDAFTFLKSVLFPFDIIFADAPYAHRDINQIPKIVAERKLLNPNGWLIVEHETTLDLDKEPNFLNKRIYGQSCFSFFSAGV